MLRRLIKLSCSDRRPYSEARAILDEEGPSAKHLIGRARCSTTPHEQQWGHPRDQCSIRASCAVESMP